MAIADVEREFLGALLRDQDAWVINDTPLAPADFSLGKHNAIFEVYSRFRNDNVIPDDIMLAEALGRHDLADGDAEFWLAEIHTWKSDVIITVNVAEQAKKIAAASLGRKQDDIAADIVKGNYDEDPIAVQEAIGRLLSLQSNDQSGVLAASEVSTEYFDMLERWQAGQIGISTGLASVDKTILGLDPGTLHLLAGRPGMGKSALGISVARNILKQGKSVLFFTLEMPKYDVFGRFAALEASVPYASMRAENGLSQEEYAEVLSATQRVAEWKLHIDDSPAQTVSDMTTKALAHKAKYGLDLVVVDHLGLATMGKLGMKQYDEQSGVAAQALAMPKILNVPVLGLLQLSRNPEARGDKRPTMSDLRATGKWEENAHGIYLLYRAGYYDEGVELPHLAELIIAKNRNGATGTKQLYWDQRLMKFSDLMY